MKHLSEARIGYAGYSPDFSAPGDRRRFVAYASQRGLKFENARLDGDYDLVVVTHNADLPGWLRRKQQQGDKLHLVFELVDTYFAQTGRIKRLLKPLARRAFGYDSAVYFDFLSMLRQMCAAADAVLCSTLEQKAMIEPLNPTTFVSFDYFSDDLGVRKADYRRGDRLKVVWEGMSVTLPNLLLLTDVLNELEHEVELHVVTDPAIPRFFGRYLARSSLDLLAPIRCPKVVHPWRRDSFARLTSDCDVAIIPIDTADRMAAGKPENKLVMFWQLGMPTLASPTAAYSRAMAAAGFAEMICAKDDDWLSKLRALAKAPSEDLSDIGARAHDYASAAYGGDAFRANFDEAFKAIGFSA